jgi:hypothetical protein
VSFLNRRKDRRQSHRANGLSRSVEKEMAGKHGCSIRTRRCYELGFFSFEAGRCHMSMSSVSFDFSLFLGVCSTTQSVCLCMYRYFFLRFSKRPATGLTGAQARLCNCCNFNNRSSRSSEFFSKCGFSQPSPSRCAPYRFRPNDEKLSFGHIHASISGQGRSS